MKQTINEYDFTQAFIDCGRADSFSYEGRKALFEWFEQYEEDTGEEVELDVIAICCDFSEYESCLEAATEYGYEADEDEEEDDIERDAMDWLSDRTVVIEHADGVIIQAF